MNMAAPTGTPAAAFLAAIIVDPADNSPRLMYADWLTERGDPLGEFIKVQCSIGLAKDDEHCPKCGRHWEWRVGAEGQCWCEADHEWTVEELRGLRRRELELFKKYGHQWSSACCPASSTNRNWSSHDTGQYWIFATGKTSTGFDLWVVNLEWRRGFVAHVVLNAECWFQHADAITATTPIEEVTLTTWPKLVDGASPGDSIWKLEGRKSWTFVRGAESSFAVVDRLLKAEWPGIKFNLPPPEPEDELADVDDDSLEDSEDGGQEDFGRCELCNITLAFPSEDGLCLSCSRESEEAEAGRNND